MQIRHNFKAPVFVHWGFFVIFAGSMILNTRKPRLTADYILTRISEYDIYERYIGKSFTVGKVFSSPLRKDRNPSFLIFYSNGSLSHLDYGHSEHSGKCFDFVMQMFGINFDKALRLIDKDFGLGIVSGEVKEVHRTEITKSLEKAPSKIQVEIKDFTSAELEYWKSYHISPEILAEENVYSVGSLYINKVKIYMASNEMVFGYLYENKFWKIYRPKEKKKFKWISSVPNKLVDGIENIVPGQNIIVQKSKKDKMCMRLITPYVCSVQNESLTPFTEETVRKLKVAKNVYICFDSDEAGVNASNKVTSEFGFKHVNVPYEYLKEGIKDFAEMVRIYGVGKVKDYLKSKNIV